MPVSFYQFVVPPLMMKLSALDGILEKTGEQLVARNIDEAVVLHTRLYPNMFPLVRQVQLAADFAKNPVGRLSGVQAPKMPDEETTLAQLRDRIAATKDYIAGVTPEHFDGRDEAEVQFPVGPSEMMTLKGIDYFANVALPNFYFHMATAYGILRQCGFEIGKRDFIGA